MDMQNVSRIGVSRINTIFEEIGFAFREQFIEDYGIDAIIEERKNDYLSGQLIAVQIKSGTSFFKEETNNKIVYRGEMKHYDYWLNYSLPVIIVLYNPITHLCIYESVTADKIIKTNKAWKMEIDMNNRLENAKSFLEKLANEQTEYQRKLSMLVFSKDLMELAKKDSLILEVLEWVNKSSGRGEFKLKKRKSDNNEEVISEKCIWGFGLKSYERVIQELFPWATIKVDEKFYDLNGDVNFINRTRDGRKIYPYTNSAGEVDRYRLKLCLNDIGNAFLTLDPFLNAGNYYNIKF